jgi:hypothetical protein
MWHDFSFSRLMPLRLLILIFIFALLACNEESNSPTQEKQWELIVFSGKAITSCSFGSPEDEPERKKKSMFTELTGLEDEVYERIYIRVREPDQFAIVKTKRVVMAGSRQMFGDSMVWQHCQENIGFKILFQSSDSLKLHTDGDSSSVYDVSLTFIKK